MSKENNVCYFIYMPLLFLLWLSYPFSPFLPCILAFLSVTAAAAATILLLCCLLFALLLFSCCYWAPSLAPASYMASATALPCLPLPHSYSLLMAKVFVRLHCTMIMIVFRHVTIICYISLQLWPRSLFI